MAEINLFRRRWHIASDALPLFSLIIALFYLSWLIAFLFGTYALENTGLKYDCQEEYLLRLANYSLIGVFFMSCAVEMTIVGIGLQGGPLEPGKRRAMTPFLYLKVALFVLLIIFTALGTYVVASPVIPETCWQQNPCVTSKGYIITNDCKLENGTVPVLTPPCKAVFSEVNDFEECWEDWIGYAFSWNATGRNWTQPDDCQMDSDIVDIIETEDGREVVIELPESALEEEPDPIVTNETIPANFTAEFQRFILDELGVPWTEGNVSGSAPWWFCFSRNCKRLLGASDQCAQWDVLVNLSVPDTTSEKAFFEGMIYSTWGTIVIFMLMGYALFNSFPDYSTLESWEGSLKGMANFCCSGKHLEASTESGSEPVSKEIARCLFMLFGGIDLDPSDRLLGMYLVAEQQKRRRQRHVLQALQAAGIVKSPGRSGALVRAWKRIAGSVTGSHAALTPRRSSPQASTTPRTAAPEHPQGQGDVHPRASARMAFLKDSQLGSSSQGPVHAPHPALPPRSLDASVHSTGSAPSPLPKPSPFEGSEGSMGPQSLAASSLSPRHTGSSQYPSPTSLPPEPHGGPAACSNAAARRGLLLPMYRHTMLRLRTGVVGFPEEVPEDPALHASEEDEQGAELPAAGGGAGLQNPPNGGALGAAQGAPRPAYAGLPPPVVQAATRGSDLHMGSCRSGGTLGSLASWEAQQGPTPQIQVVQQYHPMLTPSGCVKRLPITPQQAADIYSGKHEPVPKSLLSEAQRMSKFAIGAYGLQSVIWGKGREPAMCMGNINMLVKCMGKPLRMESKFRKRNFNAIMKVTGTKPADLLYVSYANASGGALPYLIMLHRETKSVVLSVRGTASTEDMVTDLIGTPVPVDDWMPEWVNQANNSGEKLYAHTGMMRSATAILRDLEEKGLLNELLLSQLSRSSSTITTLPSRLGSVVACYGKGAGMGAGSATLGSKLEGWHQAQQGSTVVGVQSNGKGQQSEDDGEEGEVRQDGGGGAGEGEDAAPDLSHMSADAEVKLPLKRAQSVIRSRLQTEGWQVVVTGHSLGAAVACLISFHLKDAFPDLHCWAFNPPGGLLSLNLSRIAQRLCTSIVVGKDVISRMSFSTSKRLVNEMVLSLARCKRPKLKVLADMLLRRGTKAFKDTLCGVEDMSNEAVEILERYYKTSRLHSSDQVEMYPPGRLVFLRPFKGKGPQQTVWDAVWVDAPALIDEGILVSASMRSHHRLFVMSDALRSAVEGEARHAQQGLAEEDRMHLAE